MLWLNFFITELQIEGHVMSNWVDLKVLMTLHTKSTCTPPRHVGGVRLNPPSNISHPPTNPPPSQPSLHPVSPSAHTSPSQPVWRGSISLASGSDCSPAALIFPAALQLSERFHETAGLPYVFTLCCCCCCCCCWCVAFFPPFFCLSLLRLFQRVFFLGGGG